MSKSSVSFLVFHGLSWSFLVFPGLSMVFPGLSWSSDVHSNGFECISILSPIDTGCCLMLLYSKWPPDALVSDVVTAALQQSKQNGVLFCNILLRWVTYVCWVLKATENIWFRTRLVSNHLKVHLFITNCT